MLRDTAGTFAELVASIDSASFIFLIAAVIVAVKGSADRNSLRVDK